jgi:hypothetical protein
MKGFLAMNLDDQDPNFQEYYTIEEVRELIKIADKPCCEKKAYKVLNEYHPDLLSYCKNSKEKMSVWAKEQREKPEYSKKHIDKLSYVLEYLNNRSEQPYPIIGSVHIDAKAMETTKETINSLLRDSKYFNFLFSKHSKKQAFDNRDKLTIVIGRVIPLLYEDIFETKWTWTRPVDGDNIPRGKAILFTQKILEKYKIKKNNEAIVQAYRGIREAMKKQGDNFAKPLG